MAAGLTILLASLWGLRSPRLRRVEDETPEAVHAPEAAAQGA